ncbi:MAG: SH3 domain-containing protein [Chloroflexota bacterium]
MIRSLLILMFALGVIAAGSLTPVEAQELTYNCATAPTPRLIPGQPARVTPGLPNLIRSQPGTGWNSVIIGQIPGSGVFTPLYGYAAQCANGMWWYYVTYNGITGWTPEGSAYGEYWTEPIMPAPACSPAPRLVEGQQGRVTPGLPNVIRSQPWRGSGSIILGTIPAGGVFTVLPGYGPQCDSLGMYWRYVSYNGITGWTPEGQGSTYWLEPYDGSSPGCAGLTSQLFIGAWARVTPGLPNNLRAEPSPTSAWLGRIPAGGIARVLNGPQCNQGILWWQVNYNGIIGWTGEGTGWQRWMELIS